jgi:hypothetical protein
VTDTIWGSGLSHRYALLVAYLITLLCWDRIARRRATLWPAREEISFARPWLEIACFAVTLVAVLAIGQLYQRHWLLPTAGSAGPVFEALNQILIFGPVLALPAIRRQGWDSAWLPLDRVWLRILIGIILSLIALLVFTSVRSGSAPWIDVIRHVYHPKNLGHLVQVFCEDVAIAILFVRMRAAIGLTKSIITVAVLFAAAHIPAMLVAQVGLAEILGLVADAGLGIVVLYFLQRSADVWWFWWVHFVMDMMQFYAVPGAS